MWKRFVIKHPETQVTLHMYRDVFNSDFNLRFGVPRSDTCVYCDRLYIKLIAANDENERKTVERESQFHHSRADLAYKSLAEDTTFARANSNTIVLCVDLQQVLFLPKLRKVKYETWLSGPTDALARIITGK